MYWTGTRIFKATRMRRSLRESKIFAPFSTNPHFAREAKMTSNMNATALKANHYPSAVSLANPAADSQPLCVRCGYSGSDVRILGCGCTFHARCLPLPATPPLKTCPMCHQSSRSIHLIPMCFHEVDSVKKIALTDDPKRVTGKKRKEAAELDSSECRTGRWTSQETRYVDEIIKRFESGMLPLCDGLKLNDFLSGILQCKQSRLTKKMKNAKLSARSFVKTTGYLSEGYKDFSEYEHSFYNSIVNETARAEVRFHMQKEWRELFSNLCANTGQPLDADDWLSSVEEKERRVSQAKDAARHERRKLMMKYALSRDSANPDRGVYMDFRSTSTANVNSSSLLSDTSFGIPGEKNDDIFNLAVERSFLNEASNSNMMTVNTTPAEDTFTQLRSRPQSNGQFASKIISYIQRYNTNNPNSIPFEHVDLWVPSFVTPDCSEGQSNKSNEEQRCRLCYAGSATVDPFFLGKDRLHEYQNLLSFGEYSQKFSFAVGHGLPGRVYHSGIPTWEQSVHNAPVHHFERCGGALQYGIKTVVGIPVPSPNVGCVVVVLYSCHDRSKDQSLVGQLSEEFSSYLPNPKWKLVVDVGNDNISSNQVNSSLNVSASTNSCNGNFQQDKQFGEVTKQIGEVVKLLGEHMPSDPSSPLVAYAPGYISLRLMLLNNVRSDQENEWMRILLGSYSSYASAGRNNHDIAALLARDFMFLQQQSQQTAQSHLSAQMSNLSRNGSQSTQQQMHMHQNNDQASLFAMQQSQQQQNNMSNNMQYLPITQGLSQMQRSYEAPRTLITE